MGCKVQVSAILIPLLPLLSGVLCYLFAARLGDKFYRISIVLNGATVVCAIDLFLRLTGVAEPGLKAAFDIPIYLHADALGAVMALTVSAISLVVHIFSIRYMRDDAGYVRFFVLLDGITAVVLLMVLAGDLITLLVCWHLIGVLLYFLLNHNIGGVCAHRYAFWTLITYRIGDLPLLLAVVLLYQAYDTVSLPLLFERIAAAPMPYTVFGLPLLELVGYLVIFSAFAKSAQFPLHTWLPYSMEGPTPVSALMHAGIVNAGGFLINRFAPVFVHTENVLHLALVVGLITAIIGSILMLIQNDVKKSLGYSTMSQMGYMIMECGLGAFSLAIFHLIAHGVFKGTLFLGSGSIIGAARKANTLPEDELYKLIVEHRTPPEHLSWLFFALITMAAPLLILGLVYWFAAVDVLRYQGAIVLLFFGWVSGAQTLFTTYRLGSKRPWKLLLLTVLSFTLVVIGYVLIGHRFDTFLYPDADFRERLYEVASIDLISFYIVVGFLAVLLVVGWFVVHHTTVTSDLLKGRFKFHYLGLYSLFSRELYITDLYARLAEIILTCSRRLNVLMRWG